MSFQMTVAEVKALGAEQMGACLDCMAAAVLADGEVGPKEYERLKKIVRAVPWVEAGYPENIVQMRLDSAALKVKGLNSVPAIKKFIKECARLIPQQETRQGVLFLMAAVCNADGNVNQSEMNVLGEYALEFDIGAQTVQQIAKAAREWKV